MSNKPEVVVETANYAITDTSDGYAFVSGNQYELHHKHGDTMLSSERLSGWTDGERLLERLRDADHEIAEPFANHLNDIGE